jgi:lipopolysaccharide biosynthesis regulator YciM
MLPTLVPTETFPVCTPEKPSLSNQDLLDVDETIIHLSRKVKENVHLVDEYIELGRLFRKKGSYQKAFVLHRNLLVREDLKREQQARVYGELGYDYLASQTKDHGEAYFLQSLRYNKDSHYVLEGLYQCYRQTNELEKAADILRAISKHYPNRKKDLATLLSEVALKKAEKNQISSAKKYIEYAFDNDADCMLAYLTKAQVFSLENKRKEAIEVLEEFIEKWPASTLFALKKIETLYYEMNQYPRYSYTLNKCIQKNPQNFYAHHAFGKYLIKIRKNDEAIGHFQKALDLCPYSIQSLKEVIHIYSQKQDMKNALSAIENFLGSLNNQQGFNCPRCREGFSDLSKDCPICSTSNKVDSPYTTSGI